MAPVAPQGFLSLVFLLTVGGRIVFFPTKQDITTRKFRSLYFGPHRRPVFNELPSDPSVIVGERHRRAQRFVQPPTKSAGADQ